MSNPRTPPRAIYLISVCLLHSPLLGCTGQAVVMCCSSVGSKPSTAGESSPSLSLPKKKKIKSRRRRLPLFSENYFLAVKTHSWLLIADQTSRSEETWDKAHRCFSPRAEFSPGTRQGFIDWTTHSLLSVCYLPHEHGLKAKPSCCHMKQCGSWKAGWLWTWTLNLWPTCDRYSDSEH